jgi:hypothetical protein
MDKITLRTNGRGLWSREAREVTITDMRIGFKRADASFGELRVYFDTGTWDVTQHGLIYTDRGFIVGLRNFLDEQGLPGANVNYSEQGMQGDNYVSLDVDGKFLSAWSKKFGE